MAIQTAYRYDQSNFTFTGQTTNWNSDYGPLVFGWTTVEPPAVSQYEIQVFDINLETWSVVPDFVGVTLYTPDGFTAPAITQIGVSPDSSWLLSPNLAYYQRQQIAAMIAASDAAIDSDAGFSSSATGTAYTYGTSGAFREELEAAQAQAAFHNGESGWSITLTALDSAKWPTVVAHTATQVLSVVADQAAAIAASRAQLAARIASIRAITDDSATGYAAVQAIAWLTPA